MSSAEILHGVLSVKNGNGACGTVDLEFFCLTSSLRLEFYEGGNILIFVGCPFKTEESPFHVVT